MNLKNFNLNNIELPKGWDLADKPPTGLTENWPEILSEGAVPANIYFAHDRGETNTDSTQKTYTYYEVKNEKISFVKAYEGLESERFFKVYLSDDRQHSHLVKDDNGALRPTSPENIKDTIVNYISQSGDLEYEVRSADGKVSKQTITVPQIKTAFMNAALCSKDKLEYLPVKDIKFAKDMSSDSKIFFLNGYVVITKNDFSLQPYTNLDGFIWEKQIIKRNFLINGADFKGSYRMFVLNVCGQDLGRFRSLKSLLGYLLHRKRKASCTKIIELIDEIISSVANGRSGKSLILKSLIYLRSVCILDGKDFDPTNRFKYQDVNIDVDIIIIDDATTNFQMEPLYHALSESLVVEKKGQATFRFPYDKTPKFAICTNYGIKGKGGSAEDRKFTFQVSSYYNKDHKPTDDFQVEFFSEDWSDDEWNDFYLFNIECIQEYLNDGLIPCKLNSNPNQVSLEKIDPEFLKWAALYFSNPDQPVFKKAVALNCLVEDFVKQSNNEEIHNTNRPYFTRNFMKWVRIYAEFKGWESVDHNTSVKGTSVRNLRIVKTTIDHDDSIQSWSSNLINIQ